MRTSTALLSVLALVLAGCGGSESSSKSEKKSTTTQAKKKTDSSAAKAKAAQRKLYESQYGLALATGAQNSARYCVRKIGAQAGAEQPPSPAMKQSVSRLVSAAQQAVKEVPNLKVAGKPLPQFLQSAADTLRNGQCDTAAAAKLEDLALKVP